jgi:hypothetical protein
MLTEKLMLCLMMMVCPYSQIETRPARPHQEPSQPTMATLAGEYLLGDGFVNETLNLSVTGRLKYLWSADDGGISHGIGEAKVVDGRLVLKAVIWFPNREPKLFPEYYPIRWDKRLYLLSESDMLPFCNAINLGLEPRDELWGRFYVRFVLSPRARDGVEEPKLDKAVGLPELPRPWSDFLLKRQLHGRVIHVLNDWRAIVDLGSGAGLRVGMELLVVDETRDKSQSVEASYGLATVVAVDAHRCTAKVKKSRLFHEFKTGQLASSKIPMEIIKGESRSFFW